jgi:hypothetical protein
MPTFKREFYRRNLEPLGNKEDRWYLAVRADDEAVFVLHEWSYLSLGAVKSADGQQEIQLSDFLKRRSSPERRALYEIFRSIVQSRPPDH